jgi:hypothetical protein
MPTYIVALRATQIRLASEKFAPISLLFQRKEGIIRGGYVWIARITYFFNSPESFTLKQKQKDYLHKLPPLYPHTVRRVMGNRRRDMQR